MHELVDVISLSHKLCAFPIIGQLKYATDDNFVGRPLRGYSPDAVSIGLLSKGAAIHLCMAQNQLLKEHNLGLIVYDAYRPKQAVKDIYEWSISPHNDSAELKLKQQYHPALEKSELFAHGYVSMDSQHCYAYAVDVFLYRPQTKEALDMGVIFDYYGDLSWITKTADEIGKTPWLNRRIMAQAMQSNGFIPYEKEFWHYSFHHKTILNALVIPITRELAECGVNHVLSQLQLT